MSRVFFHIRLRNRRIELAYSQKDLAYLMGLKSTARISQWEKGTKTPSAENLILLGRALHILPDELYYELWEDFRKPLAEREKVLLERRNSTRVPDTGG